MAVWTIAELTLKEAWRRRTLLGAALMGILIFGLSLLLIVIRAQMQQMVASGVHDTVWFSLNYPLARSVILSLCLFAIRTLGSLFAILLAGGAVSGEIERGLLAIILPRPIPRWQILLGKWLGLNIVLVGSVLVWSLGVWASLTLQTHAALGSLLLAGLYLTLFPIVICTLTLTLATVLPRLVAMTLALSLSAFSWFDGILNALGSQFEAAPLRWIADLASVLVPQGCIAWWIKNATEAIDYTNGRQDLRFGVSPQFVKEFGTTYLHFAHLDTLYLIFYIVAVFLLGAVLFERRDV